MKVFISQVMANKSSSDIKKERKELERLLIDLIKDSNLEFIFEEEEEFYPLYLLGKSLEKMSEADLIIFSEDWKEGRGCRIEHQCAIDYNIPYIEME